MAFLGPIVASVVATRIVNQWLPRTTTLVGQLLLWGVLSLVAIATLYFTDKAARKLLPLAALFQLSVIFPDQAPPRYRVALRTGTVHQLEAQVASIKRTGLSDDKTEAAEQLIELVAALSAHDRLTRGHAERVRAYCRLIGEELGLDDDDLSKLQWAGLLHDVGKLFVPAEILNKPSALTAHEFGIIMRHPGWGAELCEPLRPWLGDWVDAVGQHHEWWNGHGYPNGLAGEEISLAARIVSVADVFDVITSVRSYKTPEGVAAARKELTRCAGTQFEPRIVRAFLTVSLGRLRLLMGPLSSLANLPALARLPLAGASTAASGAITAGALMFGGLLDDPDPPKPAAPVTQPAPQAAQPEPIAPPDGTPPVTQPPPPADLPEPRDPVIGPPAVLEVVPVAEPDVATVSEDGSIAVDVLANDRGGRSVIWVGTPDAGTATLVDGRVQFVPAPDQEGTVTFSYGIESPTGATATGTVSILVQPVNDPPSFRAGRQVEVAQNAGVQRLTGWATDVRPGPPNEAGQRVWFTAVTADASLFASLPWVDEAGTLRFTPASSASGTTTVTVQAVDDGGTAFGGSNESAPHLLTITVTPVNRRPVARDDTATVAEDGTVTISVLGNDSDPDGDLLTVTVASPSPTGTVTTNGTTITYTPAPDTNGTHTLTYTVFDGALADTATITVTVVPASDAPVAGDDIATVGEDGTATISVLGNDADPDGDPLTLTSASSSTGTASTDGTTVTYTPAPNSMGTHTITYTVSDGALTDSATITVTVTPVNDAPVAVDDTATVAEDDTVTIAVLGNDSDPDGDPLTVTVAAPSPTGTATTDGTTITYTPAPDSNGSHSITYTVSDGALTDTATVTVTVTPVNDSPSFTSGADVTIPEESPAQSIAWATGITPGPADETAQTVTFTATTADEELFDVLPAIDASGMLTFTPAADAAGTATVQVTLSDDGGAAGGPPHELTITLSPMPDAPQASDDAYVTPQDTALWVGPLAGVLANDSDEDGDSLWVAALATPPTSGSVLLVSHGGFIYVPLPGFTGQDTFTYTVTDGALTDTGTVTVLVAATSSQTYYLATSGAGSDNWDLVTSVPSDPGPDVDGDGNPGLTVKDGNESLTEIDPAKYQQWRLVTPTDLTLTGPVTLGLWSTAKDFDPNDDIDYSVWVQDCAADGTGCVTIARSVGVHVNDWNGGVSGWVYRDITVGWANHTIDAGRMLQVRVMFDHHDVWISTDPAMASALSFNQS